MSVLRVYDPPECTPKTAYGDCVPLDWQRCRNCYGTGQQYNDREVMDRCSRCDGHGSLRAAALDACWARADGSGAATVDDDRVVVLRCEDCAHPMSEGQWTATNVDCALPYIDKVLSYAYNSLAGPYDIDPSFNGWWNATHWSACEEGCRHDQPVRWTTGPPGSWGYEPPPSPLRPYAPIPVATALRHGYRVEASWRPVDVRPLGWAHDLRPEKLAVLCLRCWAARSGS